MRSREAIEQKILDRASQLEKILQGLTEEELRDAARRQQIGRQIRDVFSQLGHGISATDLSFQPLPAGEPDQEVLDELKKSDADAIASSDLK